jgi:hypothetical protein
MYTQRLLHSKTRWTQRALRPRRSTSVFAIMSSTVLRVVLPGGSNILGILYKEADNTIRSNLLKMATVRPASPPITARRVEA